MHLVSIGKYPDGKYIFVQNAMRRRVIRDEKRKNINLHNRSLIPYFTGYNKAILQGGLMPKKKTLSEYNTPFASVNGIDFHYLFNTKRGSHYFAIVIDDKKQWEISISPKGEKVTVKKII